jgi:hypothetical protein
MSEIREGRGYYNAYFEGQVPEDGPTPEETEIPLDNHYSCPLCGKTYHENQRLYFKRHMDELRDRCPKYESLTASRGELFDHRNINAALFIMQTPRDHPL